MLSLPLLALCTKHHIISKYAFDDNNVTQNIKKMQEMVLDPRAVSKCLPVIICSQSITQVRPYKYNGVHLHDLLGGTVVSNIQKNNFDPPKNQPQFDLIFIYLFFERVEHLMY